MGGVIPLAIVECVHPINAGREITMAAAYVSITHAKREGTGD
jgi:hypothetical protein